MDDSSNANAYIIVQFTGEDLSLSIYQWLPSMGELRCWLNGCWVECDELLLDLQEIMRSKENLSDF